MLNLSAVDEPKDIATKEYVDGRTVVTGVKGNSESTYRTGDVNITAANIGAAESSHNHAAGDITSGVLSEAIGGTGATSFGAALDSEVLTRAEDYGAIWLDDDEVVNVGGFLPTSYGGVPYGGTAGQVLTKRSNTSGDIEWQTPPGGGHQSTYYTTCPTAATTSAKVITVSGWVPASGDILGVRFSYANTSATPTLNVNNAGSKSIYVGNSTPNSTTNPLRWAAGDMVYFLFDGTYYRYITKAPLKTCLYNNSTGTTDDLTLSVTAANFNYMRIFFKKSNGQGQCASIDVFSPNQKYANLTIFEPYSVDSLTWFASKTVYINGTSVSVYDYANGVIYSSPAGGNGNEIAIYRIEAW